MMLFRVARKRARWETVSKLLLARQQRVSYITTDSPHHKTHKPGFRARTALAREWMRTYGFRMANVNPLRRDGLMASSVEEIEGALPSTLRPLAQSVVQARLLEDGALIRSLPPSLQGSDEEHVLDTLVEQYCSGIGYEVMHCATDEERNFFINAVESSPTWDDNDDVWCFEQVLRAGEWERLLSRRYPTCRRFSLEGLEAGALALNVMLDTFAGDHDGRRVVLGTLHRGRVNLLHTVLQKSAVSLLDQWDETDGPTYDDINMGHSGNIHTKSGRKLHVSLVSMPAHLESQDAAVNGKAYGHMISRSLSETPDKSLPRNGFDKTVAESVLPLIVHGDASFCGEGIVSETLQLSTCSGFDCGGTIHVIFNNQVGFTAETQKLRTSRHRLVNVSDLALGIRAPVLHVNAERPRDVYRAARLVTRYRQRFGKGVVLDLWGYRKHGHNEVDEPRITNVSMYQEVDRHEPVADVFADSLKGTLLQECFQLKERVGADYQAAVSRKRRLKTDSIEEYNTRETDNGNWRDFLAHPSSTDGVTGVGQQELIAALSVLTNVPEGFTLNPATQRAVSRRAELLEQLHDGTTNLPVVDWATAELLALSTLAHEGHFCRLCGQDSQRGTFTQRHAVWHDAVTGQEYYALPSLVQVIDSPLSELGVIGFEHGVSLAAPNYLVLWEAQFADFVNNGQVIIDTMLSSEKEKFGLESNLVLLLPHGYDGMGPEHSSSRLERFLTLHTDTPDLAEQTVDDVERFRVANFTVVYPSAPSNYFHVLRRSFSWPFRRPMVVLTPKRTLRLQAAASALAEFLRNGSSPTFSPVLDDPRIMERKDVESLVLCSGEIFYNVMAQLEDMPEEISRTVAIIRLEQLAPFPLRQLMTVAKQYGRADRAVWLQEEPFNMGARKFVEPFLERLGMHFSSPICRPVGAAPAVGNPRVHQKSHLDLLSSVVNWIGQVH